MPIERPSPRRTNTAQLTVAAERRVLPNGLVVILSPDDAASTVVVNIVFRAGTVYEPPNRNGMAHMAEHVMFRGTTPDADYYELLEQRGALDLGAFTGHETMNFITVMPPQELPVALWVIADRMGHLPGFIDRADLSQHLKIVLAERNERNVDREYGAVDELIDRTLFPEQHPLHSGIGGTPASLGAVNASDIKAFVERLLVPANAVLVVTGRFDPAVASQLVDQYLAGLAPGVKAANPALPRTDPEGRLVTASELLSREPRITLAWRVAGQRSEALDALEQGAVLLTLSTDGAFGTVSTMTPYMRKWISLYSDRHVIQNLLPGWFLSSIAHVCMARIERMRNVEFVHVEDTLHHLRCPLLMIHGSGDTYIRTTMAQQLFRRCRGPKEFWLVESARHNQSLHVAGDEYHRRVSQFFKLHLPLEPDAVVRFNSVAVNAVPTEAELEIA